MTIKQKQQHEALGLKRPNVMLDGQKLKGSTQAAPSHSRAEDASDAESSEEEEDEGAEEEDYAGDVECARHGERVVVVVVLVVAGRSEGLGVLKRRSSRGGYLVEETREGGAGGRGHSL